MVEKLQQLIVSERQNRLKIESQLSTAQDQIGAAERRGQLLEQKNIHLEQDVDTWKTRLAQERSLNQQPDVSGIGVPHVEQTVPAYLLLGPWQLPITLLVPYMNPWKDHG